MTHFVIRMSCAALAAATLILAATPAARAEDDPRMALIIRNLEELTRRQNGFEARIRNLESSARPKTGVIRLENACSFEITFIVNGKWSYRLAPHCSYDLTAGAGRYTWTVVGTATVHGTFKVKTGRTTPFRICEASDAQHDE